MEDGSPVERWTLNVPPLTTRIGSVQNSCTPKLIERNRDDIHPINRIMKAMLRQVAIAGIGLFAVVALTAPCQASPDTEKIKEDAKATYEKAKDTVQGVVEEVKSATKIGVEKTSGVASNVTQQVKVVVKKANEVTTNVIVRTHQSVTNTHTKVKEKVKDVTHP